MKYPLFARVIFFVFVGLFTFVSPATAQTQSNKDLNLERAWTQYRTSSFTLYTDANENKAKEILDELETFSASLKILLRVNNSLALPPLTLYQFKDAELFSSISGLGKFSGYYKDTINGPIVVLKPSTSGRSDQYSTLFHEYVHYFQRAVGGPKQPQWYSEGLADFFSSFRVGQESVFLGIFPKHNVNVLRYLDVFPLKALFSADRYPKNATKMAEFYATSWLVTNFFTLGGRNGYDDYSASLNKMLALQMKGMDGSQAFNQSFDISLEELAKQLRGYGRKESVNGLKMAIPKIDYTINKKVLSLGESYAVLSQVAITVGQYKMFQALLEKGSALNNPRSGANLAAWKEYKDEPLRAAELLAQLIDIPEDDYQSLMFVGDLYFNRFRKDRDSQVAGQAIMYYEKSINIRPQAYSLERLMTVHGMLGDRKKAAQYANKLYQLNPLGLRVNWRVGSYLAKNGNPAFAKFLLNNVVAWSSHSNLGDNAQALLNDLNAE